SSSVSQRTLSTDSRPRCTSILLIALTWLGDRSYTAGIIPSLRLPECEPRPKPRRVVRALEARATYGYHGSQSASRNRRRDRAPYLKPRFRLDQPWQRHEQRC